MVLMFLISHSCNPTLFTLKLPFVVSSQLMPLHLLGRDAFPTIFTNPTIFPLPLHFFAIKDCAMISGLRRNFKHVRTMCI